MQAGETLLSMGQPFDGMYVVRLGALKTCITFAGGSENVLAFPMKGDLVGYDGGFKNQYLTEVVALTDCELIKIPVLDFFMPGNGCNTIERLAYWAISREIAQEQSCYARSYQARTDARVARFLEIQSARFAQMGYSPTRFILPMTRRDIGNYLGVTLETVSRAFSTMDHQGIISANRREVQIHSLDALRAFSD
jgi:CRP/FNR family transcriptional regulator